MTQSEELSVTIVTTLEEKLNLELFKTPTKSCLGKFNVVIMYFGI